MRRTRKWSYVAQEATRLADLGLSPVQIAKRLEVQRSTVQRWMAAGKLADTRHGQKRPAIALSTSPAWAAAVREAYALDATDEELVRMGEAAILKVYDPHASPQVQLSAMSRFVAIVKQLALVARAAEAPAEPVAPPETTKPPARIIRRPGADPRTFLRAVR